MRISKHHNESYTGPKLYIVMCIDPCGYDSYEVGYHLTKKGAYRAIMGHMYHDWEQHRYIPQDGSPYFYTTESYYIREAALEE
jgi:hypothetical protein